MKEFKEFILRGNVVDLAVGVVIGAAFALVISSFVADVMTPLLGLINVPDFTEASIKAGDAKIRYGLFLNSAISFLLVSLVVFYLVVKPVNHLMAKHKTETDVESIVRDCPHCLSSIPQGASVCGFCTREVTDD